MAELKHDASTYIVHYYFTLFHVLYIYYGRFLPKEDVEGIGTI
jgi:hypothetical protein